MKVHTIEVNANFVTEALQARYDEVKELWACDASMSLWDQALDWFNMKHNRDNLLIISCIYNTVEYNAMLSNK